MQRGSDKNLSSFYLFFQSIERVTRHFQPLVIPAKLQKELPFKSKPKLEKQRSKPTLETRQTVVMEPKEKAVSVVRIHAVINGAESFVDVYCQWFSLSIGFQG